MSGHDPEGGCALLMVVGGTVVLLILAASVGLWLGGVL